MPLSRLVRLLAVLALLLAPLGMTGTHAAASTAPAGAAAASHDGMAAGHCAGRSGEDRQDESQPDIDCTIACSAIPAAAGDVPPAPTVIALAEPLPPADGASGRHPESDPPPPRA